MEIRKYTREDLGVPRPATGKTPVRNLRVPDPLWSDAMAKAHAEGRTLTDVITAYLHRYVATPPKIRAREGKASDDQPDVSSTP